jgi:hypothetical protein
MMTSGVTPSGPGRPGLPRHSSQGESGSVGVTVCLRSSCLALPLYDAYSMPKVEFSW